MNGDWRPTTVGQVLQLEYGKPLEEADRVVGGLYPAYGANGEKARSNRYFHDKPSIVVGRKGSAGELTLTEARFWPLDVTYFVKFDDRQHDLRFLYYLLGQLDLPRLAKGVKPGINRNEVYAIPTRVPALREQQRLVGLLDETFDGISKAKANAERNLENARAVFESAREDALAPKDGWRTGPLGDLCSIKHGFAFKGEFFTDAGEFVLLTPGSFFERGGYRERGEKTKYYIGEIPLEFLLNEGDMLTAMTEQAAGLLGSPLIVPESGKFLHNQRLGLFVPTPGKPWATKFFFHTMNLARVRKEIHDGGTGAKVRHTSPGRIQAVQVSYPATEKEQQLVADRLDKIAAESERLERIYEQKLVALNELKKSLLHHAFAGAL